MTEETKKLAVYMPALLEHCDPAPHPKLTAIPCDGP